MTGSPVETPWSLPALVAHAKALIRPGARSLLGVAGPPGSGKSTLAEELRAELGPLATRVSMDGFHLANRVLRELGLADRKGSPPSFDVGGFRTLLRRLRANDEDVVYAPEFFREFEESIAGALPIPRDVPLIIVEGNYLLLDEGPWQGTRASLDEVWYLRPDETIRLERLLDRHQKYGRTEAEAKAWIADNDEPNARVIATTAHRATRIIVPPLNTRP